MISTYTFPVYEIYIKNKFSSFYALTPVSLYRYNIISYINLALVCSPNTHTHTPCCCVSSHWRLINCFSIHFSSSADWLHACWWGTSRHSPLHSLTLAPHATTSVFGSHVSVWFFPLNYTLISRPTRSSIAFDARLASSFGHGTIGKFIRVESVGNVSEALVKCYWLAIMTYDFFAK